MASSGESIKVHLVNGAWVTVRVDESTTFHELRDRVGQHVGLPDHLVGAFDVFPVVAGYERRPRVDLNEEQEHSSGGGGGVGGAPRGLRGLPSRDFNASVLTRSVAAGDANNVLATLREFPVLEERFAGTKEHVHATRSSHLLFKMFDFSPAVESALTDGTAGLRLVFGQAVHGVVHEWPVAGDTYAYVALAAHQMGALLGPPNESTSVLTPGFLSRDPYVLAEYVPAPVLDGKSGPELRELEDAILQAYAATKHTTVQDAMRAYLAEARKLRMYGAVTFLSAKAHTSLKTKIHGRIIVAVSRSRVGFMEARTRQLVGYYQFSHVSQWGGEHSHTSWTCSILSPKAHSLLKSGTHKLQGEQLVRSESGNMQTLMDVDATVYKFMTPQGHYMSATLAKAVYQHMKPSKRPATPRDLKVQPAADTADASASADEPAPTPGSPSAGFPEVQASDAFDSWYSDDYDDVYDEEAYLKISGEAKAKAPAAAAAAAADPAAP